MPQKFEHSHGDLNTESRLRLLHLPKTATQEANIQNATSTMTAIKLK